MPVVMQMEALECGAACLCMILAYYGKWIPLEQSRKDCGISRDGSKASYILRAARGYGLEAKGYRFEPEELRERGTFPCIIHWEFNHFVVCTGFKGNKVCLNDPARGNYTVSMERFDEAFTGVCIQFAPGEGFEPSGKQRSMFSFALKRLKGTRSAVLFVVITAVIASLAGIISTGFSRVFLSIAAQSRRPPFHFSPMISFRIRAKETSYASCSVFRRLVSICPILTDCIHLSRLAAFSVLMATCVYSGPTSSSFRASAGFRKPLLMIPSVSKIVSLAIGPITTSAERSSLAPRFRKM